MITAFAAPQVASVTGRFSGSTFDGQLFPMPTKYFGPARIAIVFVPEGVPLDGSLIASNEDGDVLAMVSVHGGPPEEPSGPTPATDEVFQDLYAARDAAQKYFGQQGTFDGLDRASLSELAPSVVFDRSTTAEPHVVSVRVSSPNELAVVSTTEDGALYCIGVQVETGAGNFFYGQVDAPDFDSCRGS